MIFEIANTVISVMVISALISLSFLLPEKEGFFTGEANKTKKFLALTSLIWIVTSAGNFLGTLARIFESSLVDVLKVNVIRSFGTQVTLGKLLAFQIL